MEAEKTPLLGKSYGLSTSYNARNGHLHGSKTESALTSQLFRNSYPATLSWKDLDVYGSNKARKGMFSFGGNTTDSGSVHILKNVSGIVKHGELVALMGASGAGKTTLLNTLTGRNVNGLRVTGSIMCNGREIGRQMTSLSAYVQQDDVFVGTLTALLRLPKTMSVWEKKHRAEEVLFDVGLTKCRNTRIGIAGVSKGISGGEAKRLAFASEILTNPSILFCDEPTTGLDSFMAENIVAVLQKLARKGKTILCTIHQPASEIYLMFDKVHFLGEGRTAFFGTSTGAFTFFASQGYSCPRDFNPADHIVQTLAIVPGKETVCRRVIEQICEKFEESDIFKATYEDICETKSTDQENSNFSEVISAQQSSQFKNNALLELGALLWRGAIDNTRKLNLVVARPVRALLLGLLFGLVYNATRYNQQGITNFNGLLYFTVFECSHLAMWGVLLNIPTDWPVLLREHYNGIYRINTYYLSKFLTFAPFWVLNGVVYTCCAYFLAGLRPTVGAFFMCMFIGCLTLQVSSAMGILISCISSNIGVILNIGQPLQILLWLMGGFFIRINTLPAYVSWMQWLLWVRYSFECMLINQWHGIESIGRCKNIMAAEKTPLLGESYELSTSYNARNDHLHGSKTESALTSQLFRNSYPATLSWKDLDVYGSNKTRKSMFSFGGNAADSGPVHILKNVSGIVKHGELVALMGASGAGKTTLLNTLTGRNINGLGVTGSIMCNGREIGRQMTSLSAYVQQDDVFVGTLTVREHLIFHALLRLPNTMSVREKKHRAEEVLFDVGLTKCRNTRIGIAGVSKGISGGEAKRLAFASEILTNPSILFCDEPTTGLDSFMAENIVAVLQKLARKGKTILCTIHQPASEIYLMFDKVHFLGEGRTAFFGTSSEAFTFFASLGYPCPKDFNPADHIVQTLAVVPGNETASRRVIEQTCKEFEQSDLFKATYEDICDTKSTVQENSNFSGVVSAQQSSQFKSNALLELGALLWRGAIDNTRKLNLVVARPVRALLMGLLFGLVYNATRYNQQGITNFDGLLYFTVFEFSNLAMWGVLLNIPADWPVLLREHHNGIYTINTYYLSKFLTFAPFWVLNGVVYTCCAYFLAGLRPTVGAFFTCMFIGCLTLQVSSAMGILISCISSNIGVILNIGQPLQILLWLMGGFFIRINTLPAYVSWMQWLLWVRYSFECMLINQWHGIESIDCKTAVDIESCMTTGDEVLQSFGFNADNFGFNIGMMFALLLAYFVIGYFILCFRLHRSR